MIAINPADWPRLRLVVEALYRLIEQDGIAAGPVRLIEQGIGWVLGGGQPAPRLERPQRPLQRAPRPIPATRSGEELGRVRK